MTSELIPRAGIEEIVGWRNHALDLYAGAFEKIRRAAAAVAEADAAVTAACGGARPASYCEPHVEEVEAFRAAVRLMDPAQFERVARRLTDLQIWGALIERTDLDHLMDKAAKDELRRQMAYVPEEVNPKTGVVINQDEIEKGLPPVSVEVVEETLRGFAADAGRIFKRGIANAFSQLDRRFRSHDGFKIGSRVILSHAFDEWGSWNYYRNQRDTLVDIERVFLVLDGKSPRAAYAGIVGVIDEARKKQSGSSRRKSEHEGDYFRVRVFKNGNAHLWFTRKDLVEKVNKLLADYYGATVGWGRFEEAPEPDLSDMRAVGHAKNLGFFETPKKVAARVLEEAHIWKSDEEPQLRVLEPSAGTGCLARAARDAGAQVHCVELDDGRVEQLRSQGFDVHHGDFLKVFPRPEFDRVVMNPPFDRGRDIDHVNHALGFLAPGGVLVSVVSVGTEFREDRKSQAFRKMVKERGGRFYDLPPDSFAEAGTHVNTLLVRISKRDFR